VLTAQRAGVTARLSDADQIAILLLAHGISFETKAKAGWLPSRLSGIH
jgi:hypothetical protein